MPNNPNLAAERISGTLLDGVTNITTDNIILSSTTVDTLIYSNGTKTLSSASLGAGLGLTGGVLSVSIPTYSIATYMFTGLTSYIGGSYLQTVTLPNFTIGATHTITTSGVSTTPTLIGTFATNLGFPNTTIIPAGTISAHIETKKVAGANNYYVYFELYKRSNVGIETLIVTSDFSTQTAVNTTVQQNVSAFLISNTTILLTDTLVIKWYGVMLSSTATLDVYIDDNTNARLELPVTSVDPSIYVPYTNAQADLNINNHKITSLANGTTDGDAVNYTQMNSAILAMNYIFSSGLMRY